MKRITEVKTLILFVVSLVCLFLLEPNLRNKSSFAVTYFDNISLSTKQSKATNLEKLASPSATRQKSHAAEPSTFLIFIGGLGGMIVRFAKKSFDRFKRYFDLVFAVLALTINLPVLLFAAIFIKLTSKGPVIYTQNRVGRKGKIFKIYKLRSMRLDAEKGTGAVWAKVNDPRITPFGRILRKTHIDEIPQLFNVIKGEMSIVGPRPERPEMVRDLRELIKDYEERLNVTPGITGLAQVLHKYDESIEDVKKKIKYDILYIKKMCLWVDVRIMARTCTVMLTGKGAR